MCTRKRVAPISTRSSTRSLCVCVCVCVCVCTDLHTHVCVCLCAVVKVHPYVDVEEHPPLTHTAIQGIPRACVSGCTDLCVCR